MKRLTLLLALVFYISLDAHAQSTDEPKELLDLRRSFERARASALSPLEKKYVDALSVMKDRLTKQGDLNGALAVQAELIRMQPVSAKLSPSEGKLRLSKLKTVDEFFAWLGTTTWETPDGNTLRFPAANKMESTSLEGRKSTYDLTIVKVGEVSWTWGNGATPLMEISPDLESATINGVLLKLIDSH